MAISQAPIECTIRFTREPIDPGDQNTSWASLHLTSAELRRLQFDAAQLETQRNALIIPIDREDRTKPGDQYTDPYGGEELERKLQQLNVSQFKEQQRLAGALLEANPHFKQLVDNQLSGQEVIDVSLSVGVTPRPDASDL
ncbi:hypothetical protein HY338_04105 [Candidatus Gottesmanbacteria bacterium]|nr:hypothetical protein [Candidatus Gottesmanbacteria bacterium]